jgi:GNAT superfamily N-acetyltransferase
MEWIRESYRISDDPAELDLDAIYKLLSQTYWAAQRSRESIQRSITYSICFGLYHGQCQVGFARVVTDRTLFSWLCDVVIDPDYRGKGLGKWLLSCLLEHDDIKETNITLCTRDAHDFYKPFGFGRVEAMRRIPDN